MCLGVGCRDRPYVPAFHVRYNRKVQVRGSPDQIRVDFHPGGPEPLEVGSLQLDGGGVGLHCLEDANAEPQGRLGLWKVAKLLREACGDRVESCDEHAILAARRVYQRLHRILAGRERAKSKGPRAFTRGPWKALCLL